jgi:hypothetical protein
MAHRRVQLDLIGVRVPRQQRGDGTGRILEQRFARAVGGVVHRLDGPGIRGVQTCFARCSIEDQRSRR